MATFEEFLNTDSEVKKWFVDTILQEEYNVNFYKKLDYNYINN